MTPARTTALQGARAGVLAVLAMDTMQRLLGGAIYPEMADPYPHVGTWAAALLGRRLPVARAALLGQVWHLNDGALLGTAFAAGCHRLGAEPGPKLGLAVGAALAGVSLAIGAPEAPKDPERPQVKVAAIILASHLTYGLVLGTALAKRMPERRRPDAKAIR